MARIVHGMTDDVDYVKYARRRLTAFLTAISIPAIAGVMNGEYGMHLYVMNLGMADEDLENIPKQVDGILVKLV